MSTKFNKEELNRWFGDCWECWYCGENTNDCIHHIIPVSDTAHCSNSLLNVAPICNHKCHLPNHGKLVTKEWQIKFLSQTMTHLINQGYKLKEVDYAFIRANEPLFKEVLKQS